MSRSNPSENGAPNPATRWHEWNGETGTIRYYDKTAKQNVDVGADFRFMLLDELATVRGWHDPSESGIYSNEVRDTRQDVLIVKAFKGGTLAEGLYKDIKDRVNTVGGQFVANCYIAFKNGDGLSIGSLRFKGAALGAWMEFRKANRSDIYKKAIRIKGFTEGKKGRITFRMPVLTITEIAEATNDSATKLDVELQEFLAGYLRRTTRDQVERPTVAESDHEHRDEPYRDDVDEREQAGYAPAMDDDDSVPF